MALSPEHLAHLREGSGIAEEIIRQRDYQTILVSKELTELGFNREQAKHVPGLLLPVHCTDGENGLYCYRPDNPRVIVDKRKRRKSDGSFEQHVLKYEIGKGTGIRLDCPPICRPMLANPDVVLWVTEGIKKGDALASHKQCAVVLLGVWGFKGKNPFGGVTVLADWDWITLKGREVRIVFDSDVMTKQGVRQALERLVVHLQRKGAHVSLVFLPMDSGKKVGVDDYLLTHTIEELEGLIEGPRPKIKAAAPTIELLEDEPVTMRRPIALVNGRAFVAIWPLVRVTVTETTDRDGNIIKFDQPESVRERRCLAMRDDGQIFTTAEGGDDTGFERLDDVLFKLSTVPEEKHLWSTKAIKRFREGERSNPADVFKRIIEVIDHYIDFDKSLADQHTMAEMIACYILATWFLDAFQVIGYLWPNGEFGSGKSELLNAVTQMAFLGEMIMAQSTIATIRDAADYGGTLAFDEVEKLQQDKTKADLLAILLAGNRRGSTLAAKEGAANGLWVTRRFNCFCPRLFAATRLPDGALATRSIIIPLIRSIDDNKPNRMVTAVETWPHDRQKLIDDLWALSLVHLTSMKAFDEETATRAKLKGRQLEPWRAILAVGGWLESCGLSGLWDRMHALSLSYQGESLELDSTNMTSLVVKALNSLFDEGCDVVMFDDVSGRGDTLHLKTKVITTAAKAIAIEEELPIDDEHITPKRIGWIMKRLRFTNKREGGTGLHGWKVRRSDVQRYFIAFGVSSEPETTPNVTTSQVPPEEPYDTEDFPPPEPTMLYCRLHDLSFCEKHSTECLGEDCHLEEFAPATFCSVCRGVILPKEAVPLNALRLRSPEEPE